MPVFQAQTNAPYALSPCMQLAIHVLHQLHPIFPHTLHPLHAAIHVLDQLAGGVAGIERVTVVDTSPAMLDAIRVSCNAIFIHRST